MKKKNLITKRNVVISIVALVLLVFIANILMAFIILPALDSPPDRLPGAPPLPPVARYSPPSMIEILLISIANPLVLILAMGGGLWLILSRLNKKETAIPDRYRIYLTFILTVIALLSILPLSQKVIETPPPYQSLPSSSSPPPYEKHSPILPQIIVVSVLTVFVAITSYMRKFYPYSIIFALALLGVVYTIIPMPVIFIIPVLVIASALWQHNKLSMVYPVAYSAVLGIIAGVDAPNSYIGWDMLGIVFLTLSITFLSGIITIVLFVFRFKFESANEDFNKALRVTLSLIVFFIVMNLAYSHIFQPYYNPYGWSD